jgi:hypothetical protein
VAAQVRSGAPSRIRTDNLGLLEGPALPLSYRCVVPASRVELLPSPHTTNRLEPQRTCEVRGHLKAGGFERLTLRGRGASWLRHGQLPAQEWQVGT